MAKHQRKIYIDNEQRPPLAFKILSHASLKPQAQVRRQEPIHKANWPPLHQLVRSDPATPHTEKHATPLDSLPVDRMSHRLIGMTD